MRTLLIAGLFAVPLVAALSSVASADPMSAAPGNSPPSTDGSLDVAATTSTLRVPPTYVEAGAAVGFVDGYMTLGGSGEIGRRITRKLWLHTTFTRSSIDKLLANGHGRLTQATLGLDYVSCDNGGLVCGFVGADVGARNVQYSGMTVPLFCDGYCDPGSPVEEHRTTALAAARLGLDIGSGDIRLRSTLEASASRHELPGATFTESLLFRF